MEASLAGATLNGDLGDRDLLAELNEQQAALVDPLVERLALLDAAIAQHEAALAELRAARTSTRNVVRMLAPERLPAASKGPGSGKTTQGLRRGAKPAQDELFAFLRKAADDFPDGLISSAEVVGRRDWTGSRNTSNVAKLLTELHENGRLTLDHVGAMRRKFYRLVA